MNNFFESLQTYDDLVGSEYNAMKNAGMPADMLGEARKTMDSARNKMANKMYAFMTNGTWQENRNGGAVLHKYNVPWNDRTLMKNKAIADVYRHVGLGNKFQADAANRVASIVAPTKFDKSQSKAIKASIAKSSKGKNTISNNKFTRARDERKKIPEKVVKSVVKTTKKVTKKVTKAVKSVAKKAKKTVKKMASNVKKGVKKFVGKIFKKKKK